MHLIIPDIHLQHLKAEKIIKSVQPDFVVFLGDYFDDWGDTPEKNLETANWLVSSLDQKNRTHVFGNHDVSYAFRPYGYKCSGYTVEKDAAINSVMQNHWRKLRLFTYAHDYLCTHSGVTNQLYNINDEFHSHFENDCANALDDAFNENSPHKLLRIGRSRGGKEPVGGIIWCDSSEFKPIKDVKQIFGHTPQRTPRELFKNNWCIDSRSSCSHYITITEKKIELHSIDDIV